MIVRQINEFMGSLLCTRSQGVPYTAVVLVRRTVVCYSWSWCSLLSLRSRAAHFLPAPLWLAHVFLAISRSLSQSRWCRRRHLSARRCFSCFCLSPCSTQTPRSELLVVRRGMSIHTPTTNMGLYSLVPRSALLPSAWLVVRYAGLVLFPRVSVTNLFPPRSSTLLSHRWVAESLLAPWLPANIYIQLNRGVGLVGRPSNSSDAGEGWVV